MTALILALALHAAPGDSIKVTVIGTLSSGIVAIGGETTGTAIASKGITWELKMRPDQQKVADRLNGKRAIVEGELERRAGVELKERWIVTVASLKSGR